MLMINDYILPDQISFKQANALWDILNFEIQA